MDSVFEIGDIVTVKGGERCFVLRRVEYLKEIYLMLIRLKEITEENPGFFLAREVIKDEKIYLDIMTDQDDIKEVLAYIDQLNAKNNKTEE